MRFSSLKILYVLSFWLFAFSVQGNNQEINQKLRLGYTLEKTGQFEQAQLIYENLYAKYSNSKLVFRRLMKIYFDLYHFSEARTLIHTYQDKNKEDHEIDLYFAELLFRLKQPDSALVILQVLPDQNKKISAYLELGSRLMASRHFEEAIAVYLLGRNELNQKGLFTINLFTCYQYNLEYGKAVKELLLYYDAHPKQINYVQKQIMRFPMKSSVILKVLPVLYTYLEKHPDNQQVQSLIMRLLIKDNQYDKALDLTLQMESQLKDKSQAGGHLFMFGEQAAHDHAYDIAQRAYERVLEKYPNYPHRNNVWFKLSHVCELQQKYPDAQKGYTKAFEVSPKTNVARNALLARGKLERDKLHRLDESVVTFRLLKKNYPNTNEGNQANLELAESYMLLGNLNEAQDILYKYFKKINAKDANYVNVIVNLAQYQYYQGHFSKAMNLIKELMLLHTNLRAVENPLFNDGLKQMQFIQQVVMQDSMLFTSYSHSEWLIKRAQFDQAEALLDSVTDQLAPELKVYPLALKAKMYYQQKQWKKSLLAFEKVKSMNHRYLAEESLYFLGKIYYIQRQKEKALIELESFLQKYPYSLYKDEVRHLVRNLEAEEG